LLGALRRDELATARWLEHIRKGGPQTRRLNPAGFSLLCAGRGKLLMLSFNPLLLVREKSGGPPPLEPPFKVKRDVHDQRSGFVVAPGLEGLNALGPLKVHPKWRPGIRAGVPVR